MRELTKDYEQQTIQNGNINLDDHARIGKSGVQTFREKCNTKIAKNEITRCRKWFNLRTLNEGQRNCLKCDRKFLSPDVKNVRMCEKCKSYLKEHAQCHRIYLR